MKMLLSFNQNRAVGIIEKGKGYIITMNMESLHKKLNLQLLSDRRKLFMLKMMR